MEVIVKQGSNPGTFTPYMRCLSCYSKAYLTKWTPATGLDKKLREFVCSQGHKSYRRYIVDSADTPIGII